MCSSDLKIVDCTGAQKKSIAVGVEAHFKKTNNKYCREYLTTMSMEDVYTLAAKSYERFHYERFHQEKSFDDSSRMIQDKLHDVMMIKAIGEILHEVKCFVLKDQKAFDRILQWDNFSKEEKDKMTKIMVKHQQSFLEENRIVFENDVDDIDLEEFSGECVECIIKVLLEHPGMEVYKI